MNRDDSQSKLLSIRIEYEPITINYNLNVIKKDKQLVCKKYFSF